MKRRAHRVEIDRIGVLGGYFHDHASDAARAAARTGSAGDSEFTRMQAEYAAYRSFRIQEQALFELAEAFDGEARPTVIRTQDQVFRLEGTLDAQYDTWRALLR
ncbi:MAG: hypothetical protein EBY52_09885, partial [Actinobacteria bacterium]|nr:hypothetical protein [Actinomycetota bacterium]